MLAGFKAPTVGIAVSQAVMLLAVAGLSWLAMDLVFAYSVMLGGLISIIPNAYFAFKVFSQSGARAMENVVRNAYVGELIKLALTGTGFALCFVLVRPLHVPALFAGFVLVHIAGLVALVRHARHYRQRL